MGFGKAISMNVMDRSEATRRTLCLAAEALVAEKGVASLTLRRVAQAAGQKNIAAVSYHFGTIELLLRATVDLRLRDSEAGRRHRIARAGGDVSRLDAFGAWQCLAWPLLALPDEQAPHAHVRFLMHMSVAGLLSDPFDASIDRPGAPTVMLLLERLHETLGHLPHQLGRARIALSGMMFWNAVALYDRRALGPELAAVDLSILLRDVEGLVRQILTSP